MLVDANAILRYILNDNNEMAVQVDALLKSKTVSVRCEVLAEVVYVLSKVYSLNRAELVIGIKVFLGNPNVTIESSEAIFLALETYSETSMDFVDCVLYGMSTSCGYGIFTFDKQLNSMVNNRK